MAGGLAGRVTVLTGASRGIGAAVAKAYALEGAAVAVNHLPTDDMRKLAEEVADDIRDKGGVAFAVAADVSSAPDVNRMLVEVHQHLGPVDILVANAAASERLPWTNITDDGWDRMLAVNLKGAFLCARAVYPDMRARGWGRIITVTSVMADLGLPNALHYVASKAGLVGFTRSLAREVGRDGICVNAVMPGAIRTELELEHAPDHEELARVLAERQCLPRRGTPEDLVGAFLYLASPASDFMTGQVLCVDGGWNHH